MPDYELTDTYWIEKYWFMDFFWWVTYSSTSISFYSRILNVKEDDRTIEAEDETRTISTEEDRDLVT